jgi:transposase
MIHQACWVRRPVGMSRALSLDLRERVLAAVAAGASHRQVGERFGVSPASVSRWRALARKQGHARPKALGGDRRSGRIEAHKATILAELGRVPDITIEELRRVLSARGLVFGFGTLQRFFARHRITRKKRPRTRASRSAPTS